MSMPIFRKCSFCGSEIEPGTGMLFVKNDGSFHWFCNSKCRKNALKLGRNPRALKWVTRIVEKGKNVSSS